ncbi:hypothetical protein [Microvirga sp. BSC39]|uniref:hypothetical protein n=1 Tax=Microvirga sp. BSC39 TaxID=1549810 RepID=UPI0004E90C40|nr:hypothetical protein [Microvirga sp. BSC39]KFG67635.1 hypothetical protein JH26_22005 [Microvirga sp. BSC39]
MHLLTSGEAEDLDEDISLDQDGVSEFLSRLRQSEGIKSLKPAALDPKDFSDHDLCLTLEEVRRRGWAVAAYNVSDVEALISDDVDPTLTDDEIRAWLLDNQGHLQHGMCAAMHDAVNAEWSRSDEG